MFVLILLFGANKIPKLARAGGQATGEFTRGRDDVEAERRDAVADPVDDAEPAARERGRAGRVTHRERQRGRSQV